jgi:hypothetical protein
VRPPQSAAIRNEKGRSPARQTGHHDARLARDPDRLAMWVEKGM